MRQENLFADSESLQSVVISRRKDFEGLFDGFTRLRAISYVVSPDLLLEFFDKRGYTEIEVLVGENLTESYRQALAQKGLDVTQRLAERVMNGTLRVFVPDRTLHTKLYLLERQGLCRIIVSSANLTETARQASRQVNYAWYVDLPAGHPWLRHVEKDYMTQLQPCSLFMGDLMELFRQRQEEPRQEVIEAWLKGSTMEEMDLETKRVLQEISLQAMEPPGVREETVFTVKLPEAPAARRQAERFLAPLNPVIADNRARLSGPVYLRFVQENHGVPLLYIDLERKEVRLGINGAIIILTQPLPDSPSVDGALEHIEAYLQTVDQGQALNPQFAKTSMYEALLYMLTAPFANEYMKLKRSRYGAIDSRGPCFLYIHGPSQNGKSTFLRFALKLITGHAIEPFAGSDFTKRKLVGAASIGTVFPLVFDDVVITQRSRLFEEVLKSYWEVWWKQEYVSPQIVLSSNAYALREWAKSRIKRLDFDVQFVASGRSKEELARIFRVENPLFKWFSYLYLRQMEIPEPPAEDELHLARLVMKRLYEHAKRPVPGYFPEEPIENLYDRGRQAWQDLIDRLGKAKVEWDKDRASVHFSDDMQHYEIKEYEGYLPQIIKYRRRGKALIIESPNEFKTWLQGQTSRNRSWLARLFGK